MARTLTPIGSPPAWVRKIPNRREWLTPRALSRAGVATAFAIFLLGTPPPVSAQTSAPTGSPRTGTSAPSTIEQQNPMAIAFDVNARRSRLYEQKDTAGVASLYPADATYVELMPILQVFQGPEQIKGHFDELIGADAVGIVPVVRRAWRNADGSITATGDYVVISRRGPEDAAPSETSGHFLQTLRREEGGAWRIARHVFARPDPITLRERNLYD